MARLRRIRRRLRDSGCSAASAAAASSSSSTTTAPAGRPAAATASAGATVAQARCVVPNVRGKTLAQARRLLTSRRCALGRVSRAYSGRIRKSRIISQSRRPGTRHPRRTRVNVLVSRGRRR